MNQQYDYNLRGALPSELLDCVEDSLESPPRIADTGAMLEFAKVDHFAIAVESPAEAKFFEADIRNLGGEVLLPFHIWTDEIPNCPDVPLKLKKYMSVLDISSTIIVLLAPYSKGDLIDKTVKRVGSPVMHHLAYQVDDLAQSLRRVKRYAGVEQMSAMAEDHGKLDQVFLSIDNDFRIVELIKRYPDCQDTFTFKNIKTLSAGEANHVRNN